MDGKEEPVKEFQLGGGQRVGIFQAKSPPKGLGREELYDVLHYHANGCFPISQNQPYESACEIGQALFAQCRTPA